MDNIQQAWNYFKVHTPKENREAIKLAFYEGYRKGLLKDNFRCSFCKDKYKIDEYNGGFDRKTGKPICIHCRATCEDEGLQQRESDEAIKHFNKYWIEK